MNDNTANMVDQAVDLVIPAQLKREQRQDPTTPVGRTKQVQEGSKETTKEKEKTN